MKLPPNVTGNTTEISLANIVSLAKSVVPETKKLALVGNAPERDQYRPFFAPELAALSPQIDFIDLRGKRGRIGLT